MPVSGVRAGLLRLFGAKIGKNFRFVHSIRVKSPWNLEVGDNSWIGEDVWIYILFFEPDEIRGAYLLTQVRQPARPKLNEVLRLIARLGGFLGRKSDGEPGAKTIWIGLQRTMDAAFMIQALRAEGA